MTHTYKRKALGLALATGLTLASVTNTQAIQESSIFKAAGIGAGAFSGLTVSAALAQVITAITTNNFSDKTVPNQLFKSVIGMMIVTECSFALTKKLTDYAKNKGLVNPSYNYYWDQKDTFRDYFIKSFLVTGLWQPLKACLEAGVDFTAPFTSAYEIGKKNLRFISSLVKSGAKQLETAMAE